MHTVGFAVRPDLPQVAGPLPVPPPGVRDEGVELLLPPIIEIRRVEPEVKDLGRAASALEPGTRSASFSAFNGVEHVPSASCRSPASGST